jgi:hypothetical protein
MPAPRLIVHATRPEAGGAAVARWVSRNPEPLRGRGVKVLNATPGDGPGEVARWANQAARRAKSSDVTLAIADVYAGMLTERDPDLHRALGALSDEIDVCLVAYVAPQHEAIEAAWCSGGFLDGASPSQWVADRQGSFDLSEARSAIERAAPRVSVELVPRTAAHLGERPVVADFLTRFLGWDSVPEDAVDNPANQVLPLEMVNLLRERPATEDRRPADLPLLARITRSWEIPSSPAIARSREVLRDFAAWRYGAGNRALAERYGWADDPLTPPDARPVDTDTAHDALAEMDSLWRAECEPAELALILRTIDHMTALARHRLPPPRSRPLVDRVKGSDAPGADLLRSAARRGRAAWGRSG